MTSRPTVPLFNGAPVAGTIVTVIAVALILAIGFTIDPILTLQAIAVACVVIGSLAWTALQLFGDDEDDHYGA